MIALFAISANANTQQSNEHLIYLAFQKLLDLKCNYEKHRNSDSKRDSSLILYKDQINKIKNSPDIYLKYINHALKNSNAQLIEEKLSYKCLSSTGGGYINSRWYLIKKNDLYRVIKYSLFKRKDSILPENFRGLPVINEKNYNGYDKAKQGDFKIAIKFLLFNLALDTKEIRFIRNNDNQLHVLDMKKYLDRNGLSTENKEFVKWAIDYLMRHPEVSLAYLDNVYDAIRYQDYIPKDKPANNQ